MKCLGTLEEIPLGRMFRTTPPWKCANKNCFNSQTRWRFHCNNHNCDLLISFSDGVGRSGALCAILSIIERLKSEQVIDVCQSVKVIRVNRPKAVNCKVGLYHCLHHNLSRQLLTLPWISSPCGGGGVVVSNVSAPSGNRTNPDNLRWPLDPQWLLLELTFPYLVLQAQYVFCYNMVQRYLDSFNEYANFN